MLKALADEYSRKILDATISTARSVQEIIKEKDIPSTSAYRRIKFLKKNGLLKVERIILTEDGVKYELLRSTVSAINVNFSSGATEVTLKPNRPAVERMTDLFFSIRDNE